MSDQKPTRRQFAKEIAALAAAPVVVPVTAEASQPPPAAPARPATAGEILTKIVRLRYGRHLDDAQLRQVRGASKITSAWPTASTASRFQNGEEPAAAFGADVP